MNDFQQRTVSTNSQNDIVHVESSSVVNETNDGSFTKALSHSRKKNKDRG